MKSLLFNGYTVHEDGTVINKKGVKLKPWNSGVGYYSVEIAGKKWKLHRLVIYLFKPDEYIESLDVNHKDGDKANNHVSNLEMCTRSENLKHSWDNGLHASTQKRSGRISDSVSKLKDASETIRELYAAGHTSRELGRRYSVDKGTIMNIVHKRYY